MKDSRVFTGLSRPQSRKSRMMASDRKSYGHLLHTIVQHNKGTGRHTGRPSIRNASYVNDVDDHGEPANV